MHSCRVLACGPTQSLCSPKKDGCPINQPRWTAGNYIPVLGVPHLGEVPFGRENGVQDIMCGGL